MPPLPWTCSLAVGIESAESPWRVLASIPSLWSGVTVVLQGIFLLSQPLCSYLRVMCRSPRDRGRCAPYDHLTARFRQRYIAHHAKHFPRRLDLFYVCYVLPGRLLPCTRLGPRGNKQQLRCRNTLSDGELWNIISYARTRSRWGHPFHSIYCPC